MEKIKTLDELKKIRDELKGSMEIRNNYDSEKNTKTNAEIDKCGLVENSDK